MVFVVKINKVSRALLRALMCELDVGGQMIDGRQD